jgi:hypothetical protein
MLSCIGEGLEKEVISRAPASTEVNSTAPPEKKYGAFLGRNKAPQLKFLNICEMRRRPTGAP